MRPVRRQLGLSSSSRAGVRRGAGKDVQRCGRERRRAKLDTAMAVDASPDNEAALLDDMIEQILAAKGKRLVDADQVARLKKAISDLNDVLRDVGA